jgi:prophage regulatory protein
MSEERLVRLPECLHIVGMGRSAWFDLVKAGTAPQPVKIGRAALWVTSELQRFIADRIAERDAAPPGQEWCEGEDDG